MGGPTRTVLIYFDTNEPTHEVFNLSQGALDNRRRGLVELRRRMTFDGSILSRDAFLYAMALANKY